MSNSYRWICKVPGCGQPRYTESINYALCEAHYLEYCRASSKRTHQRRKNGTLNVGLGRRKHEDA